MASLTAGEIVWKINGDASGFDRSMQKAEKTTKGFSGFLSKAALGVAALGAGMVAVAKSALGNAAALEQNEIALTTMLKSANKAKAVLKEFREFGAATPFETTEIIKAGKQLIAFGVDAKNVTNTLRRIGDVAAGIGVPLGEIAEIYGKIKVSSTIYNEDLNQLASRGIPVFTELEKITGKNAVQIKKMASEGKLGFKDIEKVFKNLTEQGGTFAGLMEAQSKSLGGLWSTFKSQLSETSTEIGQRLSPAFKQLLETLNSSKIVLPAIKALFMGIANVVNGFVRAVSWVINAIESLGRSLQAKQREKEIKSMDKAIQLLYSRKSNFMKSKDGARRFYDELNRLKGMYADLQIEQAKYRLEQIKTSKTKLNKNMLKLVTGLTRAKNAVDLLKKGQNKLNESFVDGEGFTSQTVRTREHATRVIIGNTFAMKKNEEKNAALSKQERKATADLQKYMRVREQLGKIKTNLPTAGFGKFNTEVKNGTGLLKKQKTALEQTLEVMGKIGNVASNAIGQVSSIFASISQIMDAQLDKQLDLLDKQMKAELEASGVIEETTIQRLERELAGAEKKGDEKLVKEKKNALEIAQVEEKYAKKRADIEYKIALVQWQMKMAMAIATLPLTILNGITSGFQVGGPAAPAFGALFGALAGAAGALQIAAVAAARPSAPTFQTGGIVPGSQTAGDNVMAQVNSGEMILNASQQRQLFDVASGSSEGGSTRRVSISEDVTWNEIYQASKNGALLIDDRAVVNK